MSHCSPKVKSSGKLSSNIVQIISMCSPCLVTKMEDLMPTGHSQTTHCTPCTFSSRFIIGVQHRCKLVGPVFRKSVCLQVRIWRWWFDLSHTTQPVMLAPGIMHHSAANIGHSAITESAFSTHQRHTITDYRSWLLAEVSAFDLAVSGSLCCLVHLSRLV